MKQLSILFAISVFSLISTLNAQVPLNGSSGGSSTVLGPGTSPPPVFVQTANVVVTNTTTETTLIGTGFGSSTLAAGYFSVAGSILRVHIQFAQTAAAGDNSTIRLKLGGTAFAAFAMGTTASHAYGCIVDVIFTAQSVGVSGTIQGRPGAIICSDTFGGGSISIVPGSTLTTNVTLNTTTALAFDFTVAPGGLTDSFTLTQAILSGY